jgi:hypothetical protein
MSGRTSLSFSGTTTSNFGSLLVEVVGIRRLLRRAGIAAVASGARSLPWDFLAALGGAAARRIGR